MLERNFRCLHCQHVIGEVVKGSLYCPTEEEPAVIVTYPTRVRCPRCFNKRKFHKAEKKSIDTAITPVLSSLPYENR